MYINELFLTLKSLLQKLPTELTSQGFPDDSHSSCLIRMIPWKELSQFTAFPFEKPRLGLKNMAELTLLLPVEEQGLHSIRVQAPREIMAELLWTLETFSVRHQYGTYSPEQPLGTIRATPSRLGPLFPGPSSLWIGRVSGSRNRN